jgi:Fibrobacter succinogenes major domain (Fib_succ_major).
MVELITIKTFKMKTTFKKAKLTLSLLVLLSIIASCNKGKNENTIQTDQVGVKLVLSEAEFSGDQAAVTKASTSKSSTTPFNVTKEIQSGPFTVTAELTENTPTNSGLKASSTKAATKLLSLRGAVRYRIVAFNTDGTYVDQAVGDASDPNQVFFGDKLVVGNKYHFFIYSLGSTTVDPPAVYSGLNMFPTSDPLTGFTLNFPYYTENDGDFMSAVEKDVTILGNNTPTPLTTPLEHRFTRVNIQIDDSDATGVFGQADYQKGGYISEVAVKGSVDHSVGTAYAPIVNMSTGQIIPGTGIYNPPNYYQFQNLTTTGTTLMVNQQGRTDFALNLVINAGSIKIGHDINTSDLYFNFSNNGQGMKPGYSYTLKLRFNSDRYVNANNETRTATAADALYAVIGGYRWDRYNLGASSLNPSSGNLASASTQALHGNFYQWGQKAIVANAITSGDGEISGWNDNVYLPANSWNTGTESLPVKVSANDPCSAGTRIPSRAEFERLSDQTKATQSGTWGDVSTIDNMPGYDAAMIVTSKKSSDINLLFPAAGRRELYTGELSFRGREGYYATSTELGTNNTFNHFFLVRNPLIVGVSAVDKPVGINVRCIQDK